MEIRETNKNDPYRRNLKAFRLSPEALELIFCGKNIVIDSLLPEDAVIVKAFWKDDTNELTIVAKHKSFPKVQEGEMIYYVGSWLYSITPKISTLDDYLSRKINKLRE